MVIPFWLFFPPWSQLLLQEEFHWGPKRTKKEELQLMHTTTAKTYFTNWLEGQ